ncbi:MAG TPA: DUF2892 domain-containing protein [Thermomicrobiaceae bacterium]|nr:DUF2892 domain-containing protein [Thermomicrobiaceae bacterium]
MAFVNFMQSSTGRVARAALGIVLIALGLGVVHGPWGAVLAIVGLVPLAAGVLRICFAAPLFGAALRQHA